ncbi:6-phosphogluconolactonase [Paracoccus denitrificans]|jgi:6-phosphogluconolactonase|uniref:6-phosphogluconolactonase n=1 Tax=Paracoccus denitrificans (strain Pd 1222) TaxID=318586 RepID=A1B3E9_PARDP|nr:6-phosphogluconolactonase [Paracoccus denitrificans]ABL70043.1 6-phosphogluconolactonase [Paracoccus denitrificans PD1222]MBB4627128.1 6-phosphogluconolactonase [Paracoccus denitrificans]MCU7430817.1 6-phosphogluconolactonase [Paracoccus denitrificans]QAR25424.1 6-phosphogluconolactonase [Paracoccus denitrificans]UPV94311.1 6-phosphogluconolactonase [Paracoccus denitrificans]
MTLEFIEYPDREMLFLSLTDRLAGQLSQHLRVNDSASLCVPGGTTPAPLYDYLSGSEVDWPRVAVLLNDERWVDGEHLRSNGRLLRRHLLKDKAAAARYIDLYTGDERPEDAVPALAEAIAPHLPLTVLLLGMGTDMHTASLFPAASETVLALAPDAPPVMAVNSVKDEPRITLTASALRGAINTHLLIAGADKREAFERAQGLDPTEAPIRAFLGDITVHWAE